MLASCGGVFHCAAVTPRKAVSCACGFPLARKHLHWWVQGLVGIGGASAKVVQAQLPACDTHGVFWGCFPSWKDRISLQVCALTAGTGAYAELEAVLFPSSFLSCILVLALV